MTTQDFPELVSARSPLRRDGADARSFPERHRSELPLLVDVVGEDPPRTNPWFSVVGVAVATALGFTGYALMQDDAAGLHGVARSLASVQSDLLRPSLDPAPASELAIVPLPVDDGSRIAIRVQALEAMPSLGVEPEVEEAPELGVAGRAALVRPVRRDVTIAVAAPAVELPESAADVERALAVDLDQPAADDAPRADTDNPY
jgi:hypothetical protein